MASPIRDMLASKGDKMVDSRFPPATGLASSQVDVNTPLKGFVKVTKEVFNGAQSEMSSLNLKSKDIAILGTRSLG
ncbi:hypothetical protein U1Q18_051830, partial [Sarracenia purpurea var. burkii]